MLIKFIAEDTTKVVKPKDGQIVATCKWHDLDEGTRSYLSRRMDADSISNASDLNPFVCFIDDDYYAIQSRESSLLMLNDATGEEIGELW